MKDLTDDLTLKFSFEDILGNFKIATIVEVQGMLKEPIDWGK